MLESCRALPQRECKAGDEVLKEGESTGQLYVLVEGKVEVCKGDVQVSRVAEPGAVFGEMAVLLNQPHMATVKCLTDSKFLVAENARAFLDAHPEVTVVIAEMLARRLNSLTRYLVDIKHQFEDQKDHLSMVDEVLESLLHHQAKARRTQPTSRAGL